MLTLSMWKKKREKRSLRQYPCQAGADQKWFGRENEQGWKQKRPNRPKL